MISRRTLLKTGLASPLIFHPAVLAGWKELAPIPYPVQEIYPVLHFNLLVIAGGIYAKENGQLGVTSSVVAYDLKKKSWRKLPDLPEPRHHPMLCSVNGHLYAFSGFIEGEGGTWVASRDVLKLESSRSNWKRLSDAEMPFPMCETVAMVRKDKVRGEEVHLATGRRPIAKSNSVWRDHSDINHHMVFNVKTRQWREAAAAPTARNSAASAVIDGRWYITGGRTVDKGNTGVLEVYDPDKDRWSSRRSMPQAQGGLAAASIAEKMYVFGGEYFDQGGGVYPEVWEYHSIADQWRQVSFMPVPRHGLGAVTVENEIYVIGGAAQVGGRETTPRLSVFNPPTIK